MVGEAREAKGGGERGGGGGVLLVEHDEGEDVGEGDDARDAPLRVHHHQPVHLLAHDPLHDRRQRLVPRAARHAAEAPAPVLQRLRHRHVQVRVRLLRRQVLQSKQHTTQSVSQ